MSMTDPIADLLTRIRNANQVYQEVVNVPSSKLKLEVVRILKEEGFIKHYKFFKDKNQGVIRVYMKYGSSKERIINGLTRISKPGLRKYVGSGEMPRVMGGMGISVVSTSKGVITGKKCKEINVGGEILCNVW